MTKCFYNTLLYGKMFKEGDNCRKNERQSLSSDDMLEAMGTLGSSWSPSRIPAQFTHMKWFFFGVHANAFIKGTNGDGVYECDSIGIVAFIHVMA